MREIVLGTAGHVDHGKTSLVRALTGIETDRLKEEKKRGITIELGFAFLDLPCGHRLGIVDVPGHEKFVKNMVAGASGVDLVAFVVAADEGIMPQTREHFEICSLLGVKRGILIITKIDMVEPDWLEMVQEELAEFFKGSFLEGAPVAKVSSTTGEGIENLKAQLDAIVSSSDFSTPSGPFRLPIDRIFSMTGFGAVVTGTSMSGSIAVGDDVCIYPSLKKARIRGIQVHGNSVEIAEAGHRTALNIQGLEKELIDRGDMLASPDCLIPSYMLDCDFTYLSSNEKPLKNRTRVRVHIGTAEVMGRIVLLDCEEAGPGDTVNVQVLLEEPVTSWPGDRYVVRRYSPVITIGGGSIFNNCPARKRRRFKADNKTAFALYHNGEPDELALLLLNEAGIEGLTHVELEARLGIFGNRLKKILNTPISSRKIVVVDSEKKLMISGDFLEKLCDLSKSILVKFHQDNPLKEGAGKEELRSRLYTGIGQKLFNLVIQTLAKKNEIVVDNAFVRLASHKVSLKEDEKALQFDLEKSFKSAGLSPPTKKELLATFHHYSAGLLAEVMALLVQDMKLVRVTEDLYFHHDSLEKLKESLIAYLKTKNEIDASSFKELTGLTRKFSIPLMEFFDKEKVTIRVGDKRVLRG